MSWERIDLPIRDSRIMSTRETSSIPGKKYYIYFANVFIRVCVCVRHRGFLSSVEMAVLRLLSCRVHADCEASSGIIQLQWPVVAAAVLAVIVLG